MKIRLSKYIEQIEERYQRARHEWEQAESELLRENEHYDKIEWLYLNPEGKTAEHNRHNEKLAEITKRFDEIREKFSQDFEQIKENSDKVFDFGYKHKPELIDEKGLAIINNSHLEYPEIIDLAEDYRTKGNMTMYFLVAEKLREVGDGKEPNRLTEPERKARAYYETAHQRRTTRDDHALLDGFKEVCVAGLRSDNFLANGIHKLHEDFYNQHILGASEIVVDTPAPWD